MQKKTSPLLWWGLAVLTLLADQGTKYWANAALADAWVEVTPFFNLVLLRNTGAAFSFLADAGGWQMIFFSAVAIAVSFVMVRLFMKSPEKKIQSAAASLIAGGAIGNLIDRFAFGAVTDFLDFHAGSLHWPAFNVADSAIVLGVALFLLADILWRDPAKEKEKEELSRGN